MDDSLIPMIIISFIASMLSSMNVWVNNPADMRFHINDVYMAGLTASWMITLNAIYNYGYEKTMNIIIIGFMFICLFIYLIRNQVFVNKSEYCKCMIPHHSMAVLMSKK